MKTLVTGGNGFLGSWVVKRLVELGHQVRVLHRSKSDLSSIKGLPIESFLGDITDRESVIRAARDVESIFHIAALISYAPKDREAMEKINVVGTSHVIEACLQSGKPRLVFTSSVVAVGATFEEKVLNENFSYNLSKFNLGYYETKRKAEELIRNAVIQKGLDAVTVNPAVMFGAGDAVKGSRKTHLKVAEGTFPFYPPGGCNILHVADAVEGHIQALRKGRKGERYILGGDNVSIRDLFQILADTGGHPPPKIPIPRFALRGAFAGAKGFERLGLSLSGSVDSFIVASLFNWYDSSKAKKELGYQPRPGAQAVIESVHWARENGYFKD